MDPHLRKQRLWQIFEQFPRVALFRIGRAAGAPVRARTCKHELLEMLCARSEEVLERALLEGLTWRDLEDLCARIGRARRGPKSDLAARILAAIDEPARRPRWRPFAEARAFARSLALKGCAEWGVFARGRLPAKGTLPEDIPARPSPVYAKSGWTNWGDFLGTGNLASTQRTFRPFAEARAFARSLALESGTEWHAFARGRLPAKGTFPQDIPKSPDKTYARSGWTNWGDFLGTGYQAPWLRTFRPFPQARAYARSLGLRGLREWKAFCRPTSGERMLPPDIPATPEALYANDGWAGYIDWLGTEGRFPYRSYEDACVFVRSVGIRKRSEWRMYCRGKLVGHGPRPRDIPAAPDQVYRGRGWVSWEHFLGTSSDSSSKRTFRSFAAARAYVRKLGLHSKGAWHAWSAAGHRPADIPGNPAGRYRGKGWVGWGDFLGTGNVPPPPRRSFASARAFVRRLGLRSSGEYRRAWQGGRIPKDISSKIYRYPEWKGWADFLGPSYTGRWKPRTKAPA
jgi:hypothetical protein